MEHESFSSHFLVMVLLGYNIRVVGDGKKQKCKSFPYILIKSNELYNFCTAELRHLPKGVEIAAAKSTE